MADILNNVPGTDNTGDDSAILREFYREFHDYAKDTREYQQNIEKYLKGGNRSSADVRYRAGHEDSFGDFRNPFGRSRSSYGRRGSFGGSEFDRFTDAFEKSLFDALGGSTFKRRLKDSINKFAKDLGTDLEHLPEKFGDELGKYAANAFKNTKFGKKITDALNDLQDRLFEKIRTAYERGRTKSGGKYSSSGGYDFNRAAAGYSNSGLVPSNALVPSGDAGSAIGGFMEALGAISPEILIVKKALEYFEAGFEWAAEDIKSSTKRLGSAIMKLALRDIESRQQKLKSEEERWIADIKVLVEEPFNILKSAAQEVYDVWDNQLRTITATQGYSKTDLQNLMALYAEHIREAGLTRYVSGADITSNLAKVLESGLSGAVAEEFAYIATILNAAIPTQDFFEYGATYASIAANLMASGHSQSEAINAANKELTAFANNILYANRELTGGFSTGLKNASDLFSKAFQITQAAKTGSASSIAGVLTSVSAMTGALAPDLASSMVDAVVKSALGGNSSDVVALRSLAGINASNTEFLRKLATDPQGVFSTLFTNLARMQNMSNDAFMEVAEGLSSVFGISMDAFARVDFTQLAKSVADMDTNSKALNENMKLLASGQTTTTAEQLKMQQINQYMIEEGLSYVVDNAAARMIQEHMWDEQIARQITESQYAVELTGATEEILISIESFLKKIFMVMSPLYGATTILSGLASGSKEWDTQRELIGQVLKAGKVGSSNYTASLQKRGGEGILRNAYVPVYNDKYYQQLLSTGTDLDLVSDLYTLMTNSRIANLRNTAGYKRPKSHYKTWGTVSKSLASALLGGTYTGFEAYLPLGSTQQATNALQSKLAKMLSEEYIKEFTSTSGGGIAAWKASAKELGITDLSKAIESAGYKEADIVEMFESQQAKSVAQDELRRKQKEEDFWDASIQYQNQTITLITSTKESLDKFYNEWVKYFVEHEAYKSGLKFEEVDKALADKTQTTEDAIYALVDTLTSAQKLDDPQLQTNVLLAQIITLMQTILTNQASSPQLSLPTTLSGIGLGILQ